VARYEHLPIYRDALNLAVHFEKIVANFSRYHKYTLGTEMRNASRQAVKLVVHANNQTDKLQALQDLREHLEELLLLIRLAKEVRAFKSFNAYSQVVELTAKVCRQNEGWLKSLRASRQDDKNK
jgi:hypothetical protein